MPRYSILNWCEYALARAGLALFDAIPLRASLFVSRILGSVCYMLLAGRRRIAVENLLRTGVAKNRDEANRVARESFCHFAMLAVESLAALKLITPNTVQEHALIEVPPETRKLLDDPAKGTIVVTCHLGNWEVAGHIVSLHKKIVAVARRMNNPLFAELLAKRNPRCKMEIVPKHSPDRAALLRALKNGSSLAILMDQHAASHAMTVPFFGFPARTVVSAARLHIATHCPIVFGYGVRISPMKFRIVFSDPINYALSSDREKDIENILTDLNCRIEAAIRKYPEQYLWSHRRWRAIEKDHTTK